MEPISSSPIVYSSRETSGGRPVEKLYGCGSDFVNKNMCSADFVELLQDTIAKLTRVAQLIENRSEEEEDAGSRDDYGVTSLPTLGQITSECSSIDSSLIPKWNSYCTTFNTLDMNLSPSHNSPTDSNLLFSTLILKGEEPKDFFIKNRNISQDIKKELAHMVTLLRKSLQMNIGCYKVELEESICRIQKWINLLKALNRAAGSFLLRL